MKTTAKGMLKTLATRSVIAAIPVAMVTAYAGNSFVPTPPRLAEYAIQQVAEITVSPSTVGIAASPLYGQTKEAIDAQLDQLVLLGVQNIRVFVPWGSIDYFGPSEPGSATWAQLDLVMQAAAERNLGVMAAITSTPPYAVTAGSVLSGTPDPAAFAAFVKKFVGAYGSEVSAYEIWNEPNSTLSSNPIDPAAYAALLKAAYNAIKPLDPTATIVAGAVGHGVTTGATLDPVDFVKAMIAADPTIGQYFDALSYHPYDQGLAFSAGNLDPAVVGSYANDTAYNQVEQLMALFPAKKVWISEYGLSTYSYSYVDGNGITQTVSISQAQQEAFIKDLVQNWGTLGQAGPIFLYTGQDTNTGAADPEDNYGLYTDTGAPKSVIDFLTAYYAGHPQNPTGPTTPPNPTDPGAALAAALAAFAQQVSQTIAQIQAFLTTNFVQQVFTAIVTAIQNLFAGLGQPAAVANAAPLSLRVASVAASDPTATGAASPADPADLSAVADKKTTDAEIAPAAEALKTPVVTEATVTTPVAETPVVATPVATPPIAETPVVATPVVETPASTVPVVAEPAATTPAVTAPAVTAPSASAPVATAPAASAPAASSPSTPSGAGASSPGKTGGSDGDGKSDTSKSDTSKSDSSKSDTSKSDSKKSDTSKSDSKKSDTSTSTAGKSDEGRHEKVKAGAGASAGASSSASGSESSSSVA